ncbi:MULTISPECIES: hypothetical protein [Streptomyces]|uniref:hypothetical protein n=1 Tax=Streptomyces TaxID=1883 RepID=UPI0031DE8B2D
MLFAGAATVALPGVTPCGGSAAGGLLAASAPVLTAVAVFTAMTNERKAKAAPAGTTAPRKGRGELRDKPRRARGRSAVLRPDMP